MDVKEFASKHKVPLMVGGAAVVGFIFLRGRGGTAVASAPPVDTGPMPTAAPASAQPEISATQQQAEALQNQMAQEAVREQKIHFDLGLASQRTQELYEGKQQQLNLDQQRHTNEQMYYYQQQQGKVAHEQLRLLKKQEGPGGILGSISDIFGVAKKGAEAYQSITMPATTGKSTYYGAPYAPGFTPPIGGK